MEEHYFFTFFAAGEESVDGRSYVGVSSSSTGICAIAARIVYSPDLRFAGSPSLLQAKKEGKSSEISLNYYLNIP